jgi:hypothetical protein
MVSKGFALGALLVFAGCGGVATVKPDPPMDESKQIEQAVKNLASEDASQRGIAVATLGSAGPAAKSYIGDLKKLENDADANVRTLAKDAIRKIEKGN